MLLKSNKRDKMAKWGKFSSQRKKGKLGVTVTYLIISFEQPKHVFIIR